MSADVGCASTTCPNFILKVLNVVLYSTDDPNPDYKVISSVLKCCVVIERCMYSAFECF